MNALGALWVVAMPIGLGLVATWLVLTGIRAIYRLIAFGDDRTQGDEWE